MLLQKIVVRYCYIWKCV